MYSAKILADSIGPNGSRLTTMEITYPRFVHSEFMTHRVFSRNAASSRAIPISKMIERVMNDPVLPVWWGKNQSGMQANEELTGENLEQVKKYWYEARDDAVDIVRCLSNEGLHKQIANRLLEPFMWITVIVSATEWKNFFELRCHPDAQPEIQKIAYMIKELYDNNKPIKLGVGEWHLPLVDGNDGGELYDSGFTINDVVRISVGRCARVSYLTHDGKRDPQADIELHDRLMKSGHWSPFEHVAQATKYQQWDGNFFGWMQYRKRFIEENKGVRVAETHV